MKNNKKGFTLVELVIVVAVMAVLVAVAIPTVSSIVGTAEDAVDNSNAKTIESLIKLEEAKMSNEAGTTATVGASNIDDAITEGKLGLDGSFVYDPVTGVVSVGTTEVEGQFNIVCDSDAEPGEDGEDNTVVVTEVE